MSPEQVEGKEVDGRSDTFSLGAVLYEMLTGKKAIEGKTQLSVASAILEKEPAPISSVNPMMPPLRWIMRFGDAWRRIPKSDGKPHATPLCN
jgi:serine/threonine protein kinase